MRLSVQSGYSGLSGILLDFDFSTPCLKNVRKNALTMNSRNKNSSVYALAFGAHPDDVELSCSATLLKIASEGNVIAVCDLTEGEMGTRGTVAERRKEAKAASGIMGYEDRVNLNLGDSMLQSTRPNLLKIVSVIRHFQPTVIFAPQLGERHPDHDCAAKLITDACFHSNLLKLKTTWRGKSQERHKPSYLFYYLQNRFAKPDFIVDVSNTFAQSSQAVLAFQSQFYKPGSDEPESFITRKEFLEARTARAIYFGELIQARYGEGFLTNQFLSIKKFSTVFA
jgi:N-acetylglucosamine malate deacetylase 1